MPASKSEVKQLVQRMRKLRDHVQAVRKALDKARGGELHVAVTTSGRIAISLTTTFDVGPAEASVLYDINPRLIRLARSDRDRLIALKSKLIEAFDDVVKYLDARMSSLARAELAA